MEESSDNSLAQQDLRVLLDHAPDAIARFDRRLRHVYVNEATARANNRPASDFYGMSMEDLRHTPEVCTLINNGLRTVFRSGREHTLELLFQGPNGPMWYQSRMAPEFSADGSVEFVLVMSRDITELKHAELSVREVRNAAAVAQLSARMAHDIHNPLTAAINAIYLLSHSTAPDDANRVWVDLASEQLERIAVISKRLLLLSREAGAVASSGVNAEASPSKTTKTV